MVDRTPSRASAPGSSSSAESGSAHDGPSSLPLPFLLEIGVEELPSSFVDGALAALPALMTQKLMALRLRHGAVRALGTARRLAVTVEGLATLQTDLDEEVVGPPEGAAFKDGKPTRAAEAFATKNNASVTDVRIVEKEASGKQKAGRYAVVQRTERGRPARDLLGKAISDICAAIPFRKSMRWGTGDATFGRPVQWLVALHGDAVIETTFAGVVSGRTTRGHRFLAPALFAVEGPDAYESALRTAHVIVDRDARERIMMERVADAARALGGVHDPDPYLVSENASLVEEPHIVTGAFEPRFLALPAAVIRSVARGHQKYFCVAKPGSEDDLLPHYLAAVNTALVPANVIKGNDRVMRARLSDAWFFFEEDKKISLDARRAKLAGIVFHNRLGTIADKVARMTAIGASIAKHLDLPDDTASHIELAARLSKTDLVTLMVGEFPELQGHMGRAYALHEGHPAPVANAIRNHYRPVGASDAIPSDDVSSVVALADRLDTLTGCFAVGLAPTGAADPYALRRACIALLRILLESEMPPSMNRSAEIATPAPYAQLRLGDLVGIAYDQLQQESRKLDLTRNETVTKVIAFAEERLRGLLAARSSGPVADAVIASSGPLIAENDEPGTAPTLGIEGAQARDAVVHHPAYALAKVIALKAVVDRAEPWLAKAKLVTKRLSGISKEAPPRSPKDTKFLGTLPQKAESDRTIVELVTRIDEHTTSLTDEEAVQRALADTELVATKLDEIFTTILVNDAADPDTPARLAVLSYGAQCMLRIADFGKLG